MSQYFTIGELSKKLRIPISTLRYYGRKNIFLPQYRNKENNYQYYSSDQIKSLCLITMLREMNVPLNQIQDILEHPKPIDEIKKFIGEHKHYLEQQVSALQFSIQKIEEIESVYCDNVCDAACGEVIIRSFNQRVIVYHTAEFQTTETSEWESDIVGYPHDYNGTEPPERPKALLSMGALSSLKEFRQSHCIRYFASFSESHPRKHNSFETILEYPPSQYLVVLFLDTDEARMSAYCSLLDYIQCNGIKTEDILLERFVDSTIPDIYNNPSIMELQVKLQNN